MKKISIALGLLALVAGFTGCKKFLTDEPYNNISVSDIFKDFEGARTTLVGCYTNLLDASYYVRDFSIYADLVGGNIKFARPNNVVLFNTYNFGNDPINHELKDFYAGVYSNIYNANNILLNIDQARDASVQQKNRMRADAFMFRALGHFDLVRVFAQPLNFSADGGHAGIVLNTTNPSFGQGVRPVSSVAQVYAQINADLDSAMALYPQSVDIYAFGNSKTFFSLSAAQALQSRVALYRRDWPKAANLTTAAIASSGATLMTQSNYVTSWQGKGLLPETIMDIGFGNRNITGLGSYYNPASTTGYLAATNDLLNLFAPGDLRGPATMFTASGANQFTKKYTGLGDQGNNVRLLRLSEMYLNRAEALARQNNLTAALADLNVIRKRANPSAADFVTTDVNVALDEIFLERRRELCFEGQLFFDIARQGRALQRVDCSSSACSFPFPDARFASPTPLNQ